MATARPGRPDRTPRTRHFDDWYPYSEVAALVGNNQYADPWLDEAITHYSALRATGEDGVDRMLAMPRDYVADHRFGIATPETFRAAAEPVDLGPFWTTWRMGSVL